MIVAAGFFVILIAAVMAYAINIWFARGEILHLLRDDDEYSLSDICSELEAARWTVMLALMWLDNEDRIEWAIGRHGVPRYRLA